MLKTHRSRIFPVLLALLLPFITAAQAEKQPARLRAAEEKPQAPAVVGYASFSSLDALQQLLNDYQIAFPMPPFLTAPGIEAQFPFLGQGSIDPARPIGMVFFAGEGVTRETAGAFVLPVRPGTATLDTLKDNGAEVFPGHPDTLVINNFAFRRGKDHILMGGLPGLVGTLDEQLVASRLKEIDKAGKTGLLRVSVDVDAIRKQMPEGYDDFLKQVKSNTPPAADPEQQMGQDWVLSFFDKTLTRFELSLSRGKNDLSLGMVFGGVNAPATPAEFKPHAMPEGLVGKIQIACPPAAFGLDEEFINSTIDEQHKADGGTPEELEATKKMAKDLLAIYRELKSLSIGFAMKGEDDAAAYIAAGVDKNFDVHAHLAKLVESANAYNATKKSKEKIELSQHKNNGVNISRIVVSENDEVMARSEFAQQGETLYVIANVDDEKAMADFMAAAPKEQAGQQQLIQGWVDLGAIMALTPGDEELAKALKDKKIEFTASGENQALSVDVSIPDELIKSTTKELMGNGQVPPPQDQGDL